MSVLISDILTGTISKSEDQDVAVSATRTALVTGLASTDIAILDEALATAGVSYGSEFPGDANLICRTRDVEIYGPDDNRKCKITFGYVSRNNDDGLFLFHGSSSVNEDSTHSDALGNIVTVAYAYPSDYPDSAVAGKTISYSPDMIFQEPQQNLHTTGILPVSKIVPFITSWTGYTNSDSWQGYPPGCWMCTSITYDPHDMAASPPKYKITFEFQLKRRGWVQTVYFRDVNGDVPPDLVYGTGYKRVVVQGYRAFGGQFPDV